MVGKEETIEKYDYSFSFED